MIRLATGPRSPVGAGPAAGSTRHGVPPARRTGLQVWERRLRWWGICLPLVLVLAVESLHYGIVEEGHQQFWEHGIVTITLSIGVLAFGTLMVWSLERMHRRVTTLYEQTAEQRDLLAALHEAGLAVTSNLDTATVLARVAELGRQVVDAREAALLPAGAEGPSPGSADGPEPGVESESLAVPVVYKGEVLGQLRVRKKRSGPFTPADHEAMQRFAAHAAVALANARLYAQAERVATLEERERIAMDLHDGTIQSLYAINLSLEDTTRRIAANCPQECHQLVTSRLDAAIEGISRVLNDIRHYIFELRSGEGRPAELGRELARVVQEVGLGTRLRVDLKVSPDLEGALSPATTQAVLHIAREALTNVVKHADASRVEIAATAGPHTLHLRVADNGRGFDPRTAGGRAHHGLRNMRDRAQAVGGALALTSAPGAGCRVELTCPVARPAEEEESARDSAAGGG